MLSSDATGTDSEILTELKRMSKAVRKAFNIKKAAHRCGVSERLGNVLFKNRQSIGLKRLCGSM